MADKIEGVTCPRRAEAPFTREHLEGLDGFDTRHGLSGQEAIGLSCTYCGSLHPDRFMELLEQGWILSPTDKTYKAYLSEGRGEEDIARRKEAWLAENQGVVAASQLEERWAAQEPMIREGGRQAKFYYQHLSADQRARFIELHNARQIKIGYPGRLYVTPFFCRPGDRPSTPG